MLETPIYHCLSNTQKLKMGEEPKRKLKTLTSEPFLQINTTLITYFDFLIVYSRIQYFIQQPLSLSLSLSLIFQTDPPWVLSFFIFLVFYFFFFWVRERMELENLEEEAWRSDHSNLTSSVLFLRLLFPFFQSHQFFCICIYFSTLIVVWCFFFFFSFYCFAKMYVPFSFVRYFGTYQNFPSQVCHNVIEYPSFTSLWLVSFCKLFISQSSVSVLEL